jgi:hypothetical protein
MIDTQQQYINLNIRGEIYKDPFLHNEVVSKQPFNNIPGIQFQNNTFLAL